MKRLAYTEDELRAMTIAKKLSRSQIRGQPNRGEFSYVASCRFLLGYEHRLIAAVGKSADEAIANAVEQAVNFLIVEWAVRE